MGRFLIVLIAVCAGLFSFPAHADWQDEASAAIAGGKFDQISIIAAKNPSIIGVLALWLLEHTQTTYAGNRDLAAKIFAAAQPYVAQIPAGEKSKSAAQLIAQIEGQAKTCEAGCATAVSIITAALGMTSLPNIVAAAPNLHANILADASDLAAKIPPAEAQPLNDQISLAQQPITPNVSVLGASLPRADKTAPQIPSAD